MSTLANLRIALVHDWLIGMHGSEKVLESLCELFPGATLFTLVHKAGALSPVIERMHIQTSFIQNLPQATSCPLRYLPVFPAAIEQLNVKEFDLVISTSQAVAKGVIPHAQAKHICYIHSPMRYIWDMYEQYTSPQRLRGLGGKLTGLAAPHMATYLRMWDAASCNRVDNFIASSQHVKQQVWRHYRREADVIYPPVNTAAFPLCLEHDGYDLLCGTMAPHKRFDLAIEAYNKIGHRLVVVGSGREEKTLRRMAKTNVTFLSSVTRSELERIYARCRMAIFPGEEDSGIALLEAQSCGKPVVAFGRGTALETVVEGESGIFFGDQTLEALCDAIELGSASSWEGPVIRAQAVLFDRAAFKDKIYTYLTTHIADHMCSPTA